MGICVANLSVVQGITVLLEMLAVVLHCVSCEMSIFGSQETFTNVHVNRPAAELGVDVFFGGLSISLWGRGCVLCLLILNSSLLLKRGLQM